jgi:LacI family transcriptional regulator
MSVSPTIATVANKAGVSLSTVSRALRGDPRINSKTILRVKQIAEQLGYRPNPYISVLMSHLRTSKPVPFRSTLAYIDLFPDQNTWKSWSVHRKWFAGATQRAGELGYVIERFWAAEPGMTKERLTRILQTRGITGIIIPPDDTHLIYLTPRIPVDVTQFSVVTIGAQYHKADLHFCANDQFSSVRAACLQLNFLGYKRIGLVAPRYIETIVDYRFGGGFLAAQMLEQGIKAVLPVCYTQKRSVFETWFRKHKPDCVLALDPRSEIHDWISLMKISIPQDLGFATLDWDESRPEFSGISQNHQAVGAAAVDFLVNQVTRNERDVPAHAMGILIEGTWIEGKTTRPLKPVNTHRKSSDK